MNKEMIKIAEIHANRIQLALKHIKDLFPIDDAKISALKEDDFAWIELFINRFGKLQDYIGRKLIDAFLNEQNEDVDSLTMIDKLNKCERLGIIHDATVWRYMRHARNYLAHEYPDNPKLMATHLNHIFDLAPQLLGILDNLKARMP